MKKNFICKNCGKEYSRYKENSNFCSRECAKEYNNILYECDYCGKEYYVKRHRYEELKCEKVKHLYCSRECADKAQTKKVKKICERCGEEFEIGNSFKDIQRFCSKECYKKYREETSKLNENIRTCPVCGKNFKTYHENQVCCSVECARIKSRNRLECVCEYCGKTFHRIKSEVIKNTHHYCSDLCRQKALKWSDEDIAILKNNFGIFSYEEISKLLTTHRTPTAISLKAVNLGLTTSREWSSEEERLLLENYSKVPMDEVLRLIPRRSLKGIIGKARQYNLYSYYYLNNVYSEEENDWLKENYLQYSNEEIAIMFDRSVVGISTHLLSLGLYRPKDYSGYNKLCDFVRGQLHTWRDKVKAENNWTCELTGERSNIVVHHCKGFNLLLEETIDFLGFPIYDEFSQYTTEELDGFVKSFMELQDSYGQYVCITERVHKLFHGKYGYGNNTIEQWEEFVNDYNKNNLNIA